MLVQGLEKGQGQPFSLAGAGDQPGVLLVAQIDHLHQDLGGDGVSPDHGGDPLRPAADDPVADLARINAFIEEFARKAPEQYWWIHRRFKTRPEGESAFYD